MRHGAGQRERRGRDAHPAEQCVMVPVMAGSSTRRLPRPAWLRRDPHPPASLTSLPGRFRTVPRRRPARHRIQGASADERRRPPLGRRPCGRGELGPLFPLPMHQAEEAPRGDAIDGHGAIHPAKRLEWMLSPPGPCSRRGIRTVTPHWPRQRRMGSSRWQMRRPVGRRACPTGEEPPERLARRIRQTPPPTIQCEPGSEDPHFRAAGPDRRAAPCFRIRPSREERNTPEGFLRAQPRDFPTARRGFLAPRIPVLVPGDGGATVLSALC